MLAQYIKETTELLAGPELKPCVKQSVYALLVTLQGQEFYGANWMSNGSITVCPRVDLGCKTGEGYHHCTETCNQSFHAEVAALHQALEAGHNVVGGTMYVTGHVICCDNCLKAMKEAGLSHAVVLDSGECYEL